MRTAEHQRRLDEARRTRPWDPPCDRQTLMRMYVDERMTQAEIAAALGCSGKRVHTAMRRLAIPARRAIPRDQTGEANARWKGSDASYSAKHHRVETLRGKPTRCELCGEDDAERVFDWANVTGDYDNVDDYVRVCRPCHRLIDEDSYPRDPETGRFIAREVV